MVARAPTAVAGSGPMGPPSLRATAEPAVASGRGPSVAPWEAAPGPVAAAVVVGVASTPRTPGPQARPPRVAMGAGPRTARAARAAPGMSRRVSAVRARAAAGAAARVLGPGVRSGRAGPAA